MRMSQIHKLYLSNFLTGLVFWYGIEKLFMASIGINAAGVAVCAAVLLAFNLIFDIPSGMLADTWSRKGMLFVSALFLGASSVLLGMSSGLGMYLLGYVLYGVYMVSTSGTYQAITYDSLHEEGRADQYSKVSGRAYALFLAGAGVGNIASGFIAGHFSYRAAFFVTVVSCALNAVLLLTLHEPKYHKAEKKERMVRQLGKTVHAIASTKLLRTLTIILTALAIVDLFKDEFGQLYMLRYVSEPQYIGLLWALFAFSWSIGSLLAHRLRARLAWLIVFATVPLIAMSFVDSVYSLVLFMIQAVAGAALLNQIETRVQESTPSSVRASVLSVLSALGRMVAIPASFLLGWIITQYNAFWAMRFIGLIAGMMLIFWLIAKRGFVKGADSAALR